LLQSIRREQELLEERLASTGRRDPVKLVTGQTSLERACAETEELIRVMDELLSETAEHLLASSRTGA